MRDAGGVHYYGYDAHSGVRVLTDASGAVTDTYEYDAFGNLLARTGTTANALLYQGELFDFDQGTYPLRAPRSFDPRSERFSTRDTWEGSPRDPLSLNAFLYGSADPINRIDPSGNLDFIQIQAGLASFGGLKWT